MTTPTPLDQQRHLVRDFVAADRQRSQRERAAQQQFSAGEKAAAEQRAASERTAQQQYAAVEKQAEQQYTAAIKQLDDEKTHQQRQAKDYADSIGRDYGVAMNDLGALGVAAADLPPPLHKASPRPPAVGAGALPLAQLQANAGQIVQLYQRARQLLLAQCHQQALQRKLFIAAAVVAVILAVAGYFLYQRWSYDQRLAGLYQAGVTALNEQDWQVAQDRLNELLALESAYRDAQGLLFESHCPAGKAAFEAGDWQTGLAQLSEVLRIRPDNTDVRALINQYAEDIGEVTNPRDDALYIPVPAGDSVMGSLADQGDSDEHPQHGMCQ